MPKVSFVMPVKNGEDFIKNTIDSLLKQTFSDIEVVVVNDHSDDKTPQILEKIANENKNIKICNLTDKTGVGAGRNIGTKTATGEIIMPVDADDPNYSNRAENSLIELEKNNADLFYANIERYYTDTKKRELRHFQPYDEKMLKYINIVPHGASAFKREVFEKIGSYEEKFLIGEDYDFFLTAQELGYKFCSKNVAVAQYTMHSGQLTTSPDPEKIKKRQEWNRLIREKHKIYEVDLDYVKNNAAPEVVEFYVDKNYNIWFAPESIPKK